MDLDSLTRDNLWKSDHSSTIHLKTTVFYIHLVKPSISCICIYTAIKFFYLPFVISGNVIICTKGCQILELHAQLLLSALNIDRLQELIAFSQLSGSLCVLLADNGWTTKWKNESLLYVSGEKIYIVCTEEVSEE